ncbi:helix-turn-helix transcriptional regulator [Bradyrhizobium sp. dw_411]|uniref:helix-turn-helix domain-containing protein n=1 Tax=Bradyrhizobium sp. dw_411 TaxID=2720082 RepID=UPI00201C3E3F|nr:helix-turn-helix transcriptional regulator [Bradyrhizobium sp. dw_411]
MVVDDMEKPIESMADSERGNEEDDRQQKPFGERFPARESAALQTLAANLRKLRADRGWSQDALASAAKIDQNAVSLIENCRSNPTVTAVENLAEALGVPVAELLTPHPATKALKTRKATGK